MGAYIIILSKKKTLFAESTRHHPRDSIRKNCEALTRRLWSKDMARQSLRVASIQITRAKELNLAPFNGRLCGERGPLDSCFAIVRTTSRNARVIPSA
jgi:hypothetical protein